LIEQSKVELYFSNLKAVIIKKGAELLNHSLLNIKSHSSQRKLVFFQLEHTYKKSDH